MALLCIFQEFTREKKYLNSKLPKDARVPLQQGKKGDGWKDLRLKDVGLFACVCGCLLVSLDLDFKRGSCCFGMSH